MDMTVSEDIIYVGVNDHEIDLFEGQYVVPAGMAYNSYFIKDSKTAVVDTVDARFGDEWLKNIEAVSGGAASQVGKRYAQKCGTGRNRTFCF
jgi:flavorubredoxin